MADSIHRLVRQGGCCQLVGGTPTRAVETTALRNFNCIVPAELLRSVFWAGVLCMMLQTGLPGGPLETWHLRDSNTGGQPLFDIVYANGLFAAVGANGTIVTSPDGVAWTPQNSGTTASIDRITFGSGMFLANGVSDTVPYTLFRSNDGTNWTSSVWNSDYPIRGLGYANDRFFLLSSVRVGARDDTSIIFTSTNTTNWTRTNTGNLGIPVAVAYGNGLYIAVGNAVGTGSVNLIPFVLTSEDALTWRSLDFDSPRYWNLPLGEVVYANDMFLVGIAISGGGGAFALSPAGSKWTFVRPGLINVTSLAFGDGIFAAAGSVGTLATSTDGLLWTVRDPGTKYWLSGVAYGQNTFVVVGNNGLIFQSDPIVTLGLTRGTTTELSFSGPPGRTCEIHAVDQLLATNNWQTLGTVTLTNTAVSWVDLASTNKPQRFYRAVLAP